MILENEVLGKTEYTKEDIIEFVKPIYGFEDNCKFIIANIPGEPDLPFYYLQSVEDKDLNFIITSPFLFIDNYEFDLPDDIVSKLGIETPEDLFIYSLVVLKDRLEEATINLKAPIILNTKTKQARQFIVKEDYEYKYQLFKNTKEGR